MWEVRFDRLQPVAERLASNLDLAAVVEQLTDALAAEPGVAAGLLWLRGSGDPSEPGDLALECGNHRECLRLVASPGLDRAMDGPHHGYPLGAGPMALPAQTGAPLISNNLAADSRFSDKEWITRVGVQSCAALPFVREGEVVGLLAAFFREPLADKDVQALTSFARQAGLVVVNARTADALRQRVLRLEHENRCLRREIVDAQPFEQMLSASPAVRQLRERIDAAAASAAPVLIVGPPGAGKEYVARAIHARSLRAAHPILKTCCVELAETALRSDLFGHEDHAFASTAECQLGRIELAQGGSLLLDQIDRMPLPAQDELHRVMKSNHFSRIGGQRPHAIDVRFMASTTRDLAEAVRAGEFHEGLFAVFRQCVLTVPGLKDRAEEIPSLVEHYLRRFCRRYNKEIDQVDPATMAQLTGYAWPGNIRELSHVVERAVLAATDRTLRVDWTPSVAGAATACVPAGETLADIERTHIIRAVGRSGGVIQGPGGAARMLGLNPSTLRSRMAKLGIPRKTADSD